MPYTGKKSTVTTKASRDQDEKVQHPGMAAHYFGREGARGPGGYDPDSREKYLSAFGIKVGQTGNLLSKRN